MILSCLREYRRSSLDQIAELTKLPKNKLTVSLEQLVERGTIEAVGKGKTRSFMLCKRYYYNNNSNMQYVRQSGIDDVRHEELVIKLARTQNGIFTKRDVMELLGLSDTLAYNLIKRMTANGEFELSQSGRYAKYKIC